METCVDDCCADSSSDIISWRILSQCFDWLAEVVLFVLSVEDELDGEAEVLEDEDDAAVVDDDVRPFSSICSNC